MSPTHRQIEITSSWELTDGTLAPGQSFSQPAVLHPVATPPRLKIKAARYFLQLLKTSLRNEAAALFHLEALVQALRSATFVLQKVASKTPEFNIWYERQREAMQENPTLRALVDLRNASEKEGIAFVQFQTRTIVRYYHDGRLEAAMADPVIEIEGSEIERPLEAL